MNQSDLSDLKRLIAEKYNWGDPANWTNFHFKELSTSIEEVTGNRISEETLKRIFGKRKVEADSYQPQAYTLMTLIKYAETLKEKPSGTSKKKYSWWKYKNISLIILGGSILLVLLFFIFYRKKESFYFLCINPIESYPFTASFRYDVSNISDSVFCAFTDNSETYLPPDKNMINYFYGSPNIYNVHLYTRNKMLDSLKIVAWSKNWTASFYPNLNRHPLQRFKDQKFYRHENYFYASPEDLKENITGWDASFWTQYNYIYPFDEVLDELTFKTRIQNNDSTGSLPCYDTQIILFGISGEIKLIFTQLKCSRFVNLKISEKTFDGKFNDLSQFSVDVSNWLVIKIKIRDNIARVYVAEKLIFEENYSKPLGQFVGISYSFYGTGIIDDLKVTNKQDSIILESNFSR